MSSTATSHAGRLLLGSIRRWWINDDDCLLLRPESTGLRPWQRRALAAHVAGGGGFTILSDDLSAYGDGEWALWAETRQAGRSADGPLDLIDPFAATLVVRSPATELAVDVPGLDASAPGAGAEGDGPDPSGEPTVVIDAGPVILRRRSGSRRSGSR